MSLPVKPTKHNSKLEHMPPSRDKANGEYIYIYELFRANMGKVSKAHEDKQGRTRTREKTAASDRNKRK